LVSNDDVAEDRVATAATAPPSSSRCYYYGTSDADFEEWFSSLLTSSASSSLRAAYPRVFNGAVRAASSWRRRYRGNPALWRRIFKGDRVAKELIEAAPVIDAAMRLADDYEPDDGDDDEDGDGDGDGDDNGRRRRGKITIVDLASGKGYLSMFLSEMLPPEKVAGCLLVDKAWPMRGHDVLPHHMNWEHIYGNVTEFVPFEEEDEDEDEGDDDDEGGPGGRFVPTGETYFSTWPIPLHTSKQDLKQKCTVRQMDKRLFSVAPGPIFVLAIHLCGALSLRAVDMFNDHDNVSFLALKPCCLPPMAYANRGEVFRLGRHHSFDSREVCSNGRFRGDRWYGPPRWHLEGKFRSWADHLYRGTDVGGEGTRTGTGTGGENERSSSGAAEEHADAALAAAAGATDKEETGEAGRKRKFDVDVQVEGGFQNTYVFAQRRPVTETLWEEEGA